MDYGLLNYIQARIFSRLKLLFNFYVTRTVRRQDFGAKFNLTFYNGAPVADILKCVNDPGYQGKLFCQMPPGRKSLN